MSILCGRLLIRKQQVDLVKCMASVKRKRKKQHGWEISTGVSCKIIGKLKDTKDCHSQIQGTESRREAEPSTLGDAYLLAIIEKEW